jgi:hypothetical protein
VLGTARVELEDAPLLLEPDGLVQEDNVEAEDHPHGDSDTEVIPFPLFELGLLAGMGTEDEGEGNELQ